MIGFKTFQQRTIRFLNCLLNFLLRAFFSRASLCPVSCIPDKIWLFIKISKQNKTKGTYSFSDWRAVIRASCSLWKKVRIFSLAYPNVPGIMFSTFLHNRSRLMINQSSINQSINQLTFQSINQSIVNQSVTHSINQSISPSVNQSINQSVGQSINQSINQSVDQSIGHSTVIDRNEAGVDLVLIQPLLLSQKNNVLMLTSIFQARFV